MTKQIATGVIDHFWNFPPLFVKYCLWSSSLGNILQTYIQEKIPITTSTPVTVYSIHCKGALDPECSDPSQICRLWTRIHAPDPPIGPSLIHECTIWPDLDLVPPLILHVINKKYFRL